MMRIGKFTDFYRDVTKAGTKIPQEKYLKVGHYPVIDQGRQAIVGRWDSDDGICKEIPAIIFGDHTRAIKYIEEPFFIGADGVKILRPVNVQDNPKYLYYALQAARIPNLGYSRHFKALKELDFHVCSIEKQDEIVRILEKIDYLIEQCHEEDSCLNQIVKSRFIELFGNPITNEMCWNQVPLFTCVESIDNGKSFVCDSEARQGTSPAVLKLSAATYGDYRPEENKAILDDKQFVEEAAVHSGDLLFTRKNTPELVGMCAYVYKTPVGLMMPDLIFRLNTTESCNKIFLWKLINHDLFRGCIQAIATGSAKSMSNISKERLLKIKVILPPIELQKQFAAFVAQIDKSKLAVQQGLQELETLKKSLMQQYFS